jgi:predicted nucleotidyltransferase
MCRYAQRSSDPQRLHELLATFKRQQGTKYRLRTLGYFGSHARKTGTLASDVDVVQLRGLTYSRLKARIGRDSVYV